METHTTHYDRDARKREIEGHPVPTTVGSGSGAVAGMGFGSFGGPFGVVVGGIIGALAGAGAGHKVGASKDDKHGLKHDEARGAVKDHEHPTPFRHKHEGDWQGHGWEDTTHYNRLIGYDVLDQDGHRVGDVDTIWEGFDGTVAYFGFENHGRTHIVPSDLAKVNITDGHVRVAAPGDVLKNAPHVKAGSDLTQGTEDEVLEHYRAAGFPYGEHAVIERHPSESYESAERFHEERQRRHNEAIANRSRTDLPEHYHVAHDGERRRWNESGKQRLRVIHEPRPPTYHGEAQRPDITRDRPEHGHNHVGAVYLPLREKVVEVPSSTAAPGDHASNPGVHPQHEGPVSREHHHAHS
ncbi:MAG: PRC-barrel domain-containing protein [Opitutales bacterium]